MLWDKVFEPSGFALPSLLKVARDVDYATLIATPDDMTVSRGTEQAAVRDNVILEFGLFAGALGLERTFLLATSSDAKMPSDVFGLTRLHYTERSDKDIAASLNSAVLQIERAVTQHGALKRESVGLDESDTEPVRPAGSPATDPASASGGGISRSAMTGRWVRGTQADGREGKALHEELELLYSNATSQGWRFLNNNKTTLRLASPKGKPYVMSKSTPVKTREELRIFAKKLNRAGLRVNSALLNPPEDSPFLD